MSRNGLRDGLRDGLQNGKMVNEIVNMLSNIHRLVLLHNLKTHLVPFFQ